MINNNDYGNIYKVLYCKNIPIKIKQFIIKFISPSLNSEDTDIYNFDFINYELTSLKIKLTEEEKIFINYCIENNIEYLEI